MMKRQESQKEAAGNAVMQRAATERGLRLAKEYWLRIQPFIKNRPLRDAELYVATDAHLRLRQAAGRAAEWNGTNYGQRFPIPAEAFPDFGKDPFLEPEELCRNENLKPAVLAAIAAPLIQKRTAELTPIAVIGVAHNLLMAAEQYVKALPGQKRGTDRLVADVGMAFGTVTFAEIEASNGKHSGQLPLLPPVGQKKKGGTDRELTEKPLSRTAIKNAVKRFLHEHTPRMSQGEYEREQEQTERLAKEGKLFRPGIVRPMSYQEWQRHNQEAIDDCLKNDRISLQDLCVLRWERFERQSKIRQSAALKRTTIKGKPKRREKRPSSAGSSAITAGK
jgi:hypothetical protein